MKLNHSKRVLSVILVVFIVLSMAVPASASNIGEPVNPTEYDGTIPQKYTPKANHIVTDTEVPLYNQRDYPDTPYGDYGTVYSGGCGVTALAMVATYLTGTEYLPDELAERYGNYNSKYGTYLILFEDSAEDLSLGLQERTSSWKKVKAALENGQVVVSLQKKGLFTSGGHFIVLTRMTEDGKILVNDPNGDNYTKNAELIKGFAEGFTEEQITKSDSTYWIYEKKEVKIVFDVPVGISQTVTVFPFVKGIAVAEKPSRSQICAVHYH